MGELLMISICYLMEDGPEMLLQYVYVDKYSGTSYDYPDKFVVTGRLIVLASSVVSMLVALGSMSVLICMFVEVQFYLEIRAVKKYIEDPAHQRGWNRVTIDKVVDVVLELRKRAENEFMLEKVEKEMRAIIGACLDLYKKVVKVDTPISPHKRQPAAATDNQTLIRQIRASSGMAYNYTLSCFFAIGLLPFMANVCRIGASGYQMFSFRKYHPHCLKYEFGRNGSVIVRHPEFFNLNCWRTVDYFLIYGNILGLFLHFSLVVAILAATIFKTSELHRLIDPRSNLSSPDRSDDLTVRDIPIPSLVSTPVIEFNLPSPVNLQSSPTVRRTPLPSIPSRGPCPTLPHSIECLRANKI